MKNVNNHREILVSVVIPAYNSARYIRQAIDSALKQNVNLEVIVVDDASTDHLENIIADYLKLDQIIFIKNKRNLGVAESRNIGVRAAKGKYIAFLDADDWWCTGKLSKQIICIQKTSAVLCYTARRLVYDNGLMFRKKIGVKEKVNYNQLLHHNSIPCSSVLVERKVMLQYPMNFSEYHEDYLAWLRILKKYGAACGIDAPLLVYRMSTKGKSRNRIKSMFMTYGVYRIMKIGKLKSLWLLGCHLGLGIIKYRKGRIER